jgi:hypothetical protein
MGTAKKSGICSKTIRTKTSPCGRQRDAKRSLATAAGSVHMRIRQKKDGAYFASTAVTVLMSVGMIDQRGVTR